METQGGMEAMDGHFEGFFTNLVQSFLIRSNLGYTSHIDLFRFKRDSFVSSGRHILFHEIEKSYQKGVAEKEPN